MWNFLLQPLIDSNVKSNSSVFESLQIHKKRRIVGRVQCKNIKTQCPKVTCLDPILLPGRCCKVCPGHEDQSKSFQTLLICSQWSKLIDK